MIVTRARVWDVLSDPGACAEAATAGQRLLDTLDAAGETLLKVLADTAEVVPEVAGDGRRAANELAAAHGLIEPTVGRLHELGR